jgi:predicted O-linked N-acetylglucosamine transferase (SPINDLY family)
MNRSVGLRALQNAKLQKQNKKEAESLLQSAIAAYRQGRHADAQALCERVLQTHPENFNALHLLGLSKLDCKQTVEAERILREALSVNPRSPDAHSNLGVALFELNRLEEACECYRRAIDLRPNHPTAFSNLGNALIKLRRFDAALDSYDRAITLKPDYIDAFFNRGMALLMLDRNEEALASINRALSFRPRYLEALAGKGLVQYSLRQFDEALVSLNHALAIKPDFAEALVNLGRVQAELGQPDAAGASLEAAIAIQPDLASAWLGKAHLCMTTNRVAEAIAACEVALQLDPDSEKAIVYLGSCYLRQGNGVAAVEMYDRALAINPGYEETISRKIFALDFVAGAGFEIQQAARKYWWEKIGAKLARFEPRERAPDDDSGRRIAVGYVSSDFRDHSAARAFLPILRYHDASKFRVVCYSCSSLPEDEMTAECRRLSDKFVGASQLSNDQLADQIRADEIDILVDLSGHSAGHRLRTFARKPAPIQVSAWGHPTGTGLATMDYCFSDPVACPAPVRGFFAEKIYDLPCMITFEPPPPGLHVPDPPVLSRNYITFSVFNRIDKISDQALAVWVTILKLMPTSRIMIKHGALGDAFLRDALMDRFVAQGIAASRVDCVGSSARNDHLRAFKDVDISLDPFPQNGGASTWESLQMGVPVIAQLGNSISSRVAGSILEAIGLDNWVARDNDEYVAIAQKYASMPDHLKSLRSELPGIIANSPVGNGEKYTRHVEQAYQTIWRNR